MQSDILMFKVQRCPESNQFVSVVQVWNSCRRWTARVRTGYFVIAFATSIWAVFIRGCCLLFSVYKPYVITYTACVPGAKSFSNLRWTNRIIWIKRYTGVVRGNTFPAFPLFRCLCMCYRLRRRFISSFIAYSRAIGWQWRKPFWVLNLHSN